MQSSLLRNYLKKFYVEIKFNGENFLKFDLFAGDGIIHVMWLQLKKHTEVNSDRSACSI